MRKEIFGELSLEGFQLLKSTEMTLVNPLVTEKEAGTEGQEENEDSMTSF